MLISLVAGARPNFMKLAPLVKAIGNTKAAARIIHTGQHYDQKMSQTFFDELAIPAPDVNLEVGSGGQIWQVAEVMKRIDVEFEEHRPDWLVVVGDVNSTLAAALAGAMRGIKVAHVEAGLRSFDRGMPEELNRILVDSCSDLLLASESDALDNLRREGVPSDKVFLVGNVMIDTLLTHLDHARRVAPYARHGLRHCGYGMVTLHRPSNVDNPARFRPIMSALEQISAELPLLFPVHPRTRKRIADIGIDTSRSDIRLIDPVGYLEMLGLMDGARLVFTDSGGVQEETTALRVPCLTIRENTERPVTLQVGSNRLVNWHEDDILSAFQATIARPSRFGNPPGDWDGHAAERIAAILTES